MQVCVSVQYNEIGGAQRDNKSTSESHLSVTQNHELLTEDDLQSWWEQLSIFMYG